MTTAKDPDEVLDVLAGLVDAVVSGSAAPSDLDKVLQELRRSVGSAREASVQRSWETTLSVAESIGENLAVLRRRAGWTQQQLGSSMMSMGFGWSRQTVADTERGVKRRASFEELLALAALFAVPAGSLLIPAAGRGLDLNERWQVDTDAARELFLGRHGRLGGGGPGWRVAARECASVDKRPASDLARRTREEA